MKSIYLISNTKELPIRGVHFDGRVRKDVFCNTQY